MCNCASNAERLMGGTVPPISLPAPHWSHKQVITVDACIADAIAMLWKHGIVTAGCCCGHNRDAPSVILENYVSEADCQRAANLLRDHDGREWRVLQWRLVNIAK
jgi:hypothetical protein